MHYVSLFFGIIIRMFHNEHNPPHFHAEYQGQRGLFDLQRKYAEGEHEIEHGQETYSGMGAASSGGIARQLEQGRSREANR